MGRFLRHSVVQERHLAIKSRFEKIGASAQVKYLLYWSAYIYYYSVSQKNIPDIFSYNSRKHCQIFIIFGIGTHITKKAGNQ